jgi:hypothetical protein
LGANAVGPGPPDNTLRPDPKISPIPISFDRRFTPTNALPIEKTKATRLLKRHHFLAHILRRPILDVAAIVRYVDAGGEVAVGAAGEVSGDEVVGDEADGDGDGEREGAEDEGNRPLCAIETGCG